MSMTAERLRELLSYDPDTGVFVWKISTSQLRAGETTNPDTPALRGLREKGGGRCLSRLTGRRAASARLRIWARQWRAEKPRKPAFMNSNHLTERLRYEQEPR